MLRAQYRLLLGEGGKGPSISTTILFPPELAPLSKLLPAAQAIDFRGGKGALRIIQSLSFATGEVWCGVLVAWGS